MNPLLKDILHTQRVLSVDGSQTFPLHSAITAEAGEFLRQTVLALKPKVTLEIGLAFGVSGLFICEALKECSGVRHIAIDPYQQTQWQGIGMNNLRLAGFGDLVELRELPSHLSLSQLEDQGTQVDFAFIDGWHTFDHALTDFFHIDRLLRIGGIVVFDDAFFPSVHQACRYVAANRAYRVVGTTQRVGDYKPSRAARALRFIANASEWGRKLLKSKFVVTDEQLGFTPDCRCIAFEKRSEDIRGWAEHHEF